MDDVTLLYYDWDPRSLCILLERCCCDLWSLLEDGGPSSPQAAKNLTLQITSAVEEIHRVGIIHRGEDNVSILCYRDH